MSIEENKRTVERFDALLNTQELSQLDELCTADMVNHTLLPGRPAGLEGTREFLRTMGRRQWQANRWRESTVVAEGEFVVQFGIREGHWPGGPFRGIEVPAGDYTRDFAAMFRLVGGRIAERWAVRDDLGMMLHLGALTTPEQARDLADDPVDGTCPGVGCGREPQAGTRVPPDADVVAAAASLAVGK
jgi:predicted ester cyclase